MTKLNLIKKETPTRAGPALPPWRILVVDDDPEVHAVTRLALKALHFGGRGVELLHAESAAAARQLLATQADIAIALLDVVMETDDAGLCLVRFIREELNNANVRIVLRTGQPGQTPEEDVIVKYDVNDYKSKTELTARKLFTTTVTALRTYEHLKDLDAHRLGLQQIIETSGSLFEERSLQRFASGVLRQLGTFVGVGANGILCLNHMNHCAESGEGAGSVQVLAASNPDWAAGLPDWAALDLDPEVRALVVSTFERKCNQYGPMHTTLYLGREGERAVVAYLHCAPPDESLTRRLIELFCSKIAIGFSNVCLYERLMEANALLEKKVEDRTRELVDANRKLNRLASVDTLTGVPNRRCFLDALARETSRMERDGTAFCVLMLDIDHFKTVNDSYGHAVGDRVLQTVARRLSEGLRQMDMVGRLGGEEFAVLLPAIALEDALGAAERLRANVGGRPVTVDGMDLTVTVSVGVADVTYGGVGQTPLTAADAALYAAKNGGRNRVCCASVVLSS